MTLSEKLELIKTIESYATWHGMFKEKLHAIDAKPEDFDWLKETRDKLHAKIIQLIDTL